MYAADIRFIVVVAACLICAKLGADLVQSGFSDSKAALPFIVIALALLRWRRT